MSDKRAAPSTAQHPTLERKLAASIVRADRSLEKRDLDAAEQEAQSVLAVDRRCPQAYYLLGQIACMRGDAESAERHYRRAIQLDQGVGCFHHSLANLLQDRGNAADAIDSYRRALRLTAKSAEVWNDLGTAYFSKGEPEQAADCYRNAVRYSPAHGVAASNLGSTLRTLGDVAGALRAYRHEFWLRLRSIFVRSGKRRSTLSFKARDLADEAQLWESRGDARMAYALAEWALDEDRANAQAITIQATLLERRGDASAAIELLQRGHGGALRAQAGRIYMRLGHFGRAAEALQQSLAAGHRESAVYLDLALSLAADGKTSEGIQLLERRAKANGDAETWTTLARLRLDLDESSLAFDALEQALKRDPHWAAALAQMGRLRVTQKKAADAIFLCRTAVRRDASCAEAHYWLGRALGLAWLWEEACQAFREVLELDDGALGAEAAIWLSNGLRSLEKPDEAERVLREAFRRNPRDANLAVHLAMAIIDRGELSRAGGELARVLAEFPDHPGALAAMCAVKSAEGRMEDALALARKAIQVNPNEVTAHHNLGLTLLKLGRFGEAWRGYEWRKRLETHAGAYLRFPYPEWQGESLAGKCILLYAEQGLGDEIMFSSGIPEICAQARHVVLECEPRLAALFRRSFPSVAVFGRSPTSSNAWTRSLDPQPEVQSAIGSLPRFLRRKLEDFPAHSGYLRADAQRMARWRERLAPLGPGRKLGLSWRGGLARTARVRRSLELDQLQKLFAIEGLHFISLQYGNVADEVTAFERRSRQKLAHWQDALDDYDETAALVCALDGVVTVCTSIVHLTGALGRRALVMAPFSPEWRYRMTGEAMPWYPSVRIVRQRQPADWNSVLEVTEQALRSGWGG